VILLDTHALLWLDGGQAELGLSSRRAADEATAQLLTTFSRSLEYATRECHDPADAFCQPISRQ
jgi:PIN domain nuclease of toxin-antitoxin system